jgi:CBS domain-containing protein
MKRCEDVMTKDPVCCVPADMVEAVAQIMKDEGVGAVPVVEDQRTRKLVGIVTDRDLTVEVIADGMSPATTAVENVMTITLARCKVDDDIHVATELMAQHQVRRIPVVDADDCIVGIISQADVATRIEEPDVVAEVVEEISQGPAH